MLLEKYHDNKIQWHFQKILAEWIYLRDLDMVVCVCVRERERERERERAFVIFNEIS